MGVVNHFAPDSESCSIWFKLSLVVVKQNNALVNYLCLFAGTSVFKMKNMVFVPATLPGIPCVNHPILLPYE